MLEAYLSGIATSLSCEAIKGIGKVAFSRVWRAFPSALNSESNAVLQRGIYRAMLRATLLHLAELEKIKLADFDVEESNVYISRPEACYQSLTNLKRLLQQGVNDLTVVHTPPQSAQYQKQQSKYRQVISNFKIGLSEQAVAHIANAFLIDEQDSGLSEEQYVDWPQAIDTSLGEFTHALINRVIAIGKWEPVRAEVIKEYLHSTVFSERGEWFKTYALCFLDEISQDEVLFRHSVTLKFISSSADVHASIGHLEASVETKLNNIESFIKNSYQDLKADIEQWRANFNLDDEAVFSDLEVSNATAYSEMYFATEKDKFIGREEIIELLQEEFLSYTQNTADFKWLTLAGEAGTGKSRLAFELISRFRLQWPIAGFVKTQFLSGAKIEAIKHVHITAPTLFVIDYATRFIDQTLNFLARCKEISAKSAYPIRVILIMRRPNEQLFHRLRSGTDYGSVYNLRFQPHGNSSVEPDGILVLGELGNEQIVRLMRGRLGEQGKAIGQQQLIKHLEHYDRRKRPLIAALVADALKNNALHKKVGGDDNEANRLRLLGAYLCRANINRWSYSADQKQPGVPSSEGAKQLDKHIALMLLSTMVRGVTDNSLNTLYKTLPDACERLLPYRPDAPVTHRDNVTLDEEGVLAMLLGSMRATKEDPYPPLEPDLVGESMVIHFLLGETTGILPANSMLKGKNRQIITEMAWRCSAEGAAYFASMVAQDFPDHAERLNWLLPDSSHLVTPFSRSLLIRNVLAGIIVEWRSHQVNLPTVKRLEKLLKLVRFAKTHPKAARENTAQALEQISWHLAKLINSNIELPEKSLLQLSDNGAHGSNTNTSKSDELARRAKTSDSRRRAIKKVTSAIAFAEVSPPGLRVNRESDIEEKFENSNKETVQLAITLLLKVYKIAERHLWSEPDCRIRKLLTGAVANILASALWSNRHILQQGGSAQYELSEEERKIRKALLIKCDESMIQNGKLDDLATTTRLLASLLYAEEPIELSLLDRMYYIIKEKVDAGVSNQDETVLAGLLGFFCNYLVSQRVALEKIENKKSSEFSHLRKQIQESISVACELFRQMHSNNLETETYRKSLSALSDCYIRVIGSEHIITEDQKSRFSEDCWDFLYPYLVNQNKSVVGDSVVRLILLLDQPDKLIEKQIFHNNLKIVFQTIEFDQSSLCVSTKKIRTEFMKWLVLDYQGEFKTILNKFIVQVGARAGSDLLKLIVKQIPSHKVNERQVTGLLSVINEHDLQHRFNQEKRHKSLLHLWGQYLLLDKVEELTSAIQHLWSDGEEINDYKAREVAFQGVKLLARWTSPTDKQVLHFIPRIRTILQHQSFSNTTDPLPSITQSHIHAHHIALIDLISDLVKIGLSNKENIDQYLNLKEQLNE